MLHAHPTKNGTGISIFGDYGDLNALYETIHHIAGTLDENNKQHKGQHQLLMNFAYEIRKGYSGRRLVKEIDFKRTADNCPYFGFQLVWTDVLIFISVCRHNAGYIKTSALQQGYLYILEHIVNSALMEYDSAGAVEIANFFGHIPVSSPYAFIIYQVVHLAYISDRSGKTRFRKIPKLLSNYFNTWMPEYKELIASFTKSAAEQNCEITDLEFGDFPEIKW